MTYQKRYNKYGNIKQTYGGRSYDSKKEAAWAMELDKMKLVGEIKEIIPQYKIDLRVNNIHICNYYMDFKVVLSDGSIEFHEVKGFETAIWRLKWKLTEALLDEIEEGAKLVLIK